MQATYTTQTAGVARQANVDKIVECYQGELSAVETYELALKSITHVGMHRTLQEILTSHSCRVDKIREWMGRRGMEAPKSSGVRGAFAKTVQVGADLINTKLAVASLEAGEDRGIQMYTSNLEGCADDVKGFIANELLPEQQHTHSLCRTLKQYANEPS